MQKYKKSNVFLVLSSETIGLVALSHVGQTDETQTALQASLLSEESPVASCDNPLNIPPLRPLPGATKPILFVLARDEAFRLSKHMLKPYPRRNLMVEERIANYRISRGRRISENILGILGNRWHCFRASFLLQPRKLLPLQPALVHNYNSEAKEMRQEFTQWFSDEGDVGWQRRMCGLETKFQHDFKQVI